MLHSKSAMKQNNEKELTFTHSWHHSLIFFPCVIRKLQTPLTKRNVTVKQRPEGSPQMRKWWEPWKKMGKVGWGWVWVNRNWKSKESEMKKYQMSVTKNDRSNFVFTVKEKFCLRSANMAPLGWSPVGCVFSTYNRSRSLKSTLPYIFSCKKNAKWPSTYPQVAYSLSNCIKV